MTEIERIWFGLSEFEFPLLPCCPRCGSRSRSSWTCWRWWTAAGWPSLAPEDRPPPSRAPCSAPRGSWRRFAAIQSFRVEKWRVSSVTNQDFFRLVDRQLNCRSSYGPQCHMLHEALPILPTVLSRYPSYSPFLPVFIKLIECPQHCQQTTGTVKFNYQPTNNP